MAKGGKRLQSGKKKSIFQRLMQKLKKVNTTKAFTWFILVNAVAWIWTSYILAAFDKVQIAESLSSAAVTSIIGVFLGYCIKSGFENFSKNNSWPDPPPNT